jgi:hypothetical protein
MDNRFSSPNLYDKLCSKQTDATGMLHQDRKAAPAKIKEATFKKGEHMSLYKGNLMMMKWKDKKRYLSCK